MTFSKLLFAIAVVAFAVILEFSQGTLNARDSDLTPLAVAAAQTAKQQCVTLCRARYRDCRSLKQISPVECRGVYQDCTRFKCDALKG